jgi:regulator of cell morphogenesis and NO signaling
MQLSEVVEKHPSLIPVIHRFGIHLGLGSETVSQLCEKQQLDTEFFLTMINTFLNEDYFPEKKLQGFHIAQIVDYLNKTNHYYQRYQLPNIERHLRSFISMSDPDNNSLSLIGKIFDSFKEKLLCRIRKDEEEWFPYCIRLSNDMEKMPDPPSGQQTPEEYGDPIEALLNDLKHIIIKHLSGKYDENLCHAVVLSVNTLSKDIKQHNRIRYRILQEKTTRIPASETNRKLSTRETDVLQLIVAGLTNRDIADKLYISLNTVLTHRKNITAKLGIKTIPGLTFYAITHGLVSHNPVL